MTAPKPGDRVRGVVEGKIYWSHAGPHVDIGGGRSLALNIIRDVEVLPQPEPTDWQTGDLVLDASSRAWERDGSGYWWEVGGKYARRDDSRMHRPLRRARIVEAEQADR